jgi:asparagine synthase (glutamine-hydrolysing)
MGFVPGARCILTGMRKLPPAHAMVYDVRAGTARTWRYWVLPDLDETPEVAQVDDRVLEDELISLLEDAVRRQLVADVPVGIMLSGGVDSSLITAMAVRTASNVKTFTIQFPGHSKYDETEHARVIARHFGTQHSELEATASTVELLPLLARQLDEPMVDSAIIPTYLVSKVIREHCTVALGGDGGDELFGGYQHYNRWLWVNEHLSWIPRALRNSVAEGAEVLLPVGLKGRNWLQGLGADFNAGMFQVGSHFDRRTYQQLINGRLSSPRKGQLAPESVPPPSRDLLQRATRMDFENYLAEDILVKVDRASMLNSLEVRAPWLDYRIVEFAFRRVPSRLKATTTGRKVLLKQITSRLLPPEFDKTRKQGFSIPLAAWLRSGPWKDFFHSVLLDSKDSIFDRKMVIDLLKGQSKGRANSERLFALVLFELWRKEYRI